MKASQIEGPAVVSTAGPAVEICFLCTCFEGDSGLSEACESCSFCHPCRMCSKDHAAPKNGACPAPRIRVSKTGPIWYAECPLTLTGGCNPRVGCEGAKDLATLHGWAMRHAAKHKAEVQ